MTINNDTKIFKGSTPWNGKVFRGTTLIWPTAPVDYSTEYLTFTMVSGGVITYLTKDTNNLYYRVNGGAWSNAWTNQGQSGTSYRYTISALTGDRIEFKRNSTAVFGTLYGRQDAESSFPKYNVSGNIMSLAYGDGFSQAGAIETAKMFSEGLGHSGSGYDSGILNAANLVLPATSLTSECYYSLLQNAYYMTAGPRELPAPTVPSNAYDNMFANDNNMVSGPRILGSTFGNGACMNMFYHCDSLQRIECLATSWQSNSFYKWVEYVPATGTFVKHPNATWPTGVSGIPDGWTVQDAVL